MQTKIVICPDCRHVIAVGASLPATCLPAIPESERIAKATCGVVDGSAGGIAGKGGAVGTGGITGSGGVVGTGGSIIAEVRADYANGIDDSAGLRFSIREFDKTLNLMTAAGYDNVTGRGSPSPTFVSALAQQTSRGSSPKTSEPWPTAEQLGHRSGGSPVIHARRIM